MRCLRRSTVGLVSLDPRHTTHSIPGKFVSYMRSGLPVLARVNPGNDLTTLIPKEDVGRVVVGGSVDELAAAAEDLVSRLERDDPMKHRCLALADRLFSPQAAVAQIVRALQR